MSDEQLYCTECGAALWGLRFCTYCGAAGIAPFVPDHGDSHDQLGGVATVAQPCMEKCTLPTEHEHCYGRDLEVSAPDRDTAGSTPAAPPSQPLDMQPSPAQAPHSPPPTADRRSARSRSSPCVERCE